MPTDTLYDTDFVVWTERQAEALRAAARDGSNLPVDWDNLAEEVESVGRSERREVRRLVELIVIHLYKLAHSPTVEARAGWDSEIALFRRLLIDALEDSPSLKTGLGSALSKALPAARRAAAGDLRKFGETTAAAAVERDASELTTENVLDTGFYLPGTSFSWAEVAQRERNR